MRAVAERGVSAARSRAFWAAFLLGVAAVAAIDEIVFHQLLGWHHFYDRATADIGLISDGLLHAGELFCAVVGTFLMLDARRRPAFSSRAAWAGFLVGAGAFQLWDGLVNHKLLRLHQIRYDVDVVPYDIAWSAAALVLLVAGVVATMTADRAARREEG